MKRVSWLFLLCLGMAFSAAEPAFAQTATGPLKTLIGGALNIICAGATLFLIAKWGMLSCSGIIMLYFFGGAFVGQVQWAKFWKYLGTSGLVALSGYFVGLVVPGKSLVESGDPVLGVQLSSLDNCQALHGLRNDKDFGTKKDEIF